jgi:hypothetical protein
LLVVTFAAVAANAFLYFAYYLPNSSVSTNNPGIGAKSDHPDGFPELEKEGNIYATPEAHPTPVGDPVVVRAGDIAVCGPKDDSATARLIEDMPAATVVTLGDNAYENGSSADFAQCYDPTWGRFKDRTRPAVGNHEYQTPNASDYFGYFGAAAGDPDKGYYSYDLGGWHVVALNSMCGQVGGCGSGSPMVGWLKKDLAQNPSRCTLAYFHDPLFSSGSEHGNNPHMRPAWDALFAADADVVLNGHEHGYERFSPQDPNGGADPQRGMREFVVGTGGAPLYAFLPPKPNSRVRNADTHGVLKLTLHPEGYDWKFVPVAGESFTDYGTAECH